MSSVEDHIVLYGILVHSRLLDERVRLDERFQRALVRPLEMKTRWDMASGHKKRLKRLRLLGK